MPGDTWRDPYNPPVPLSTHRDKNDVANEVPTADQSRIFVTVDSAPKIDKNDYAYNCLGWVCFTGPAPCRRGGEPDFEYVENLSDVTETLTKNGYVACSREEATCIVTGEGPYKVGHVYSKWQGRSKVKDAGWLKTWGAIDWWESRLGPAGVTIIHERDALTGTRGYENKLAYFKPN